MSDENTSWTGKGAPIIRTGLSTRSEEGWPDSPESSDFLITYLISITLLFDRLAKIWAHPAPDSTGRYPVPAVLFDRTYLISNEVLKLQEISETLLPKLQLGKHARPRSILFKCRTR